MSNSKGFTLIEVMIAIALTAVAVTLAYGGLDSAIRLASNAEEETDHLRQMNRAFDVLGRDFRQAIARPVRNPEAMGHEPAFMLDEFETPMLRFSRTGWSNPVPQRFQRSHLQRVNYHYDGEKLIRYSWQMMDRYQDSEEQEVILLDNVTDFSIRALNRPDISGLDHLGGNVQINLDRDGGGNQWASRWPPDASAAGDNQAIMPVAVELTMTLKRWGEIRRVFELAGADSR